MDMKTIRTARTRQYLSTFIANLAPFSHGVAFGWMSPTQMTLMSDDPPVGDKPFTESDISWVGSAAAIGGVIGTLFWGKVSDKFGRKCAGYILSIPFVISWLTMIFANNIYWMIVSRLLVGVGCSGAIINSPMYVSEIAEDKIRGCLASFVMLFVQAGILFSYTVGAFVPYRYFNYICLSLAIVNIIAISWLPESPVYLFTRGKKLKAEKSLLWLRGNDSMMTSKEIALMESRPVRPSVSILNLFRTKGSIRALALGIALVTGQQFCGALSISTYASSIFKESGSALDSNTSTIIIGALQFFSACASTVLVDRAGRKFLLALSFIIMALSSNVLGTYLYTKTGLVIGEISKTYWSYMPIIALSLHVIAFGFGAGPVPIIVMAEIFSPEIKGVGISTCQFIGVFLVFVNLKMFPTIVNVFGQHGAFWFFGFCNIAIAVFTIALVPETKGRTLKNILQQLNGELKNDVKDVEEGSELFTRNRIQIVKMKKENSNSNEASLIK